MTMESEHNTIQILYQKLSTLFHTSEFTIESIAGGASRRKYYRIFLKELSYLPVKRLALMTAPSEELPMLQDFVDVYHYLKRKKIATPRLYEVSLEQSWLLLELMELPTLEEYLGRHPEKNETVMTQLVDFLSELQKRCAPEKQCPAFRRKFDAEKYMFEFDFHLSKQLLAGYYQYEFPEVLMNTFKQEIATTLNVDVPVFVHRDFQSSNIFYNENSAEHNFYLIDFQDARHGAPVYDLVSCLWDSYISLDASLRDELVKKYFYRLSLLNISWDWPYYQKMIDYTVIQRKLHDAGAFAYNYFRLGSRKYVPYIVDAIEMACERMKRYPQFAEIRTLFEQLKAPKR